MVVKTVKAEVEVCLVADAEMLTLVDALKVALDFLKDLVGEEAGDVWDNPATTKKLQPA